jgi:hypothetical protein
MKAATATHTHTQPHPKSKNPPRIGCFDPSPPIADPVAKALLTALIVTQIGRRKVLLYQA